MSQSSRLVVFAYDISADRVRTRVADLLDQHLTRVQGSVFEGWLTMANARSLANCISIELEPEDSLRVYCIGRGDLSKCMVFDSLPLAEPHDSWFV